MDGEPRTVIGVMPQGFKLVPWEDGIAFWAANDLRRIPQARWQTFIGRLKPGVSVAAAEAEATSISRHVLEARGEKAGGVGARVVPIHKAIFGGAENILTFLLGAVSFVLLIACANVANLLLAAGAARQKELALRAATGAGRGRLVRQLLTENVVLSLVGCGCGLVLAFWGTRLFALIVPTGFPELLRDVHVDAARAGLRPRRIRRLQPGLRPPARAARVARRSQRRPEGRRTRGQRRRASEAGPRCWWPRSGCRWSCSWAPA